MEKKWKLADRQHKTNLKLIWGTMLFLLFTISIMLTFYLIDNGGYEALAALRE